MRRAGLTLAVALVVTTAAGGTSAAAPAWAPAGSATIRPGAEVVSASGQCTANFVFYDDANVYIGQAAHCTSGGGLSADGCTAGSLPLGTPITVGGASKPGVLAYNSWLTMQQVGETDPDACQFNDFALVRIDPADVGRVNPSVPHWGGPVGLSTGTGLGQPVYSYGNSSLRLGLTVLSPKVGVSVATGPGGWSHLVYAITPGIPGDSGSAVLDARGRALGVLSSLVLAPLVGSNAVGDLRRQLDYLHAHTPLRVQLALGTEPFDAGKFPLGL